MNKIITLIIIFFALTVNLTANINLKARTGILVDFNSDEILFELI